MTGRASLVAHQISAKGAGRSQERKQESRQHPTHDPRFSVEVCDATGQWRHTRDLFRRLFECFIRLDQKSKRTLSVTERLPAAVVILPKLTLLISVVGFPQIG